MKKAIIIQARMGSKRFPNKILKKIDHRSVLQYLIDRLSLYFPKNEILIATTRLIIDDQICNISKANNINFYRGSENNLIKRYLNCAKKYNVSNIIRITSDCPLVNPTSIKKMYNYFINKKIDYYSNTCPPDLSKYPDGSDIEIFSFKALDKLNNLKQNKVEKEHVYGFWKNKKIFKTKILKKNKDISKFKYSLDYKSDLILLQKIVKKLKKKNVIGSSETITNLIMRDKKLLKISNQNQSFYLKNKNFKPN